MLRFRYTKIEVSSQMSKQNFLVALAFLLTPATANAYIDPGIGSFILQALVASFLGGLLYTRLAWDRTRLFFARLFSRHQHEDTEDTADADERAASQ